MPPTDARRGARPVPRLTGRGRVVLDTDVVSLYRAGHLPAGFTRQVVANDISIAFATAGELWKGAMAKRWGAARRAGSTCGWPRGGSFPPAW